MVAPREPIAIVGMGALLPGAADLEAFWENVLARRSAARRVPPELWPLPPEAYYDPRPGSVDKVYSLVGCFLDEPAPSGEGLHLSSDLLAGLDPVFRITVEAGRRAYAQARMEALDPARVGVILAQIALPTQAATELTRQFFDPLIGRSPSPLSGRWGSGWSPLNAWPAALPASTLAAALGLRGLTFSLDAACASSLYALKLACDGLADGRADAILAGGVCRPDSLFTQMGFCQLRALSPSGRCAPFDARADGIVVGEGAAIFVLKRLSDARRQGDRILGLIRACGISNDRRGSLMAPEAAGQRRALEAAYRQAGWRPESVDLIEAHGTGTPLGDATEFSALRSLWNAADRSPRCVLGSVKSNVGHLLTAAGAAALIKTLLALERRVLPPTAHFERPASAIDLASGPFRLLKEPEPWPEPVGSGPRRAAVSAFGFGGINAHLLVEEWRGEDESVPQVSVALSDPQPPPAVAEPIAIVGMALQVGRCDSIEALGAAPSFDGLAGPVPRGRWWGLERLDGARRLGLEAERRRGAYLSTIRIGRGRFRIPPSELRQMLPQQLLMLEVAERALRGVRLDELQRETAGVFIGLGLDLNTTNFGLRWTAERRDSLEEPIAPPLTAERTLGSLGSMVASRVAREFRFGGPAFALAADGDAGLRALETAARALRASEISLALVGAVELGGDPRMILLRRQASRASNPGLSASAGSSLSLDLHRRGAFPVDGAVALVLKPLAAARASGDVIFGLLGDANADRREEPRPRVDFPRATCPQLGPLVGLIELVRSASEEDGPGQPVALAAGADEIAPRRGPPRTDTDEVDASPEALVIPAAGPLDLTAAIALGDDPPKPSAEVDRGFEPPDRAASPRGRGRRPCDLVLEALGREVALTGAPTEPGAFASPASAAHAAYLNFAAQSEIAQRRLLADLQTLSGRARERHGAFSTRRVASQERVPHDRSRSAVEEKAGSRSTVRAETRSAGVISGEDVPRRFSKSSCQEFARGSLAAVLGDAFAEADRFPTRVRLPDDPLMLVDRIVAVEGQPRSLAPGGVITEHVVAPGAWYLDHGRMAAGVTIEAGQADLFLAAFLGVDFETRGLSHYRLLDADVTFHRGLPRPGETLRYDIRIDRFARQGATHLFFFHFDATADGEPLLSMRDGCAGFFTEGQLRSGRGLIEREPPREAPRDQNEARRSWFSPWPDRVEAYDASALDALRRGELAAAFGSSFGPLPLLHPFGLPAGRLALLDRVTALDPVGGPYGLGLARAEADIRPDAWHLTCHFVDDPVMPGTLMYESCLQLLRILLLRQGWVGEADGVGFEPVPGLRTRLRCRGQVVPATRRVSYEVWIKGVSDGPMPRVRADALMLADGRPIVRVADLSLQLTGTTRDRLAALWREALGEAREPVPAKRAWPRERLVAFSEGKPSDCFGAPYAIFDAGRFCARLPRPPFLFLDRVTGVEGEPFRMRPGVVVEAEHDVHPDAWYFAAHLRPTTPYAVLLEIALQTCGFASAYVGSALRSDDPLHYRNLGGRGILRRPVGPEPAVLHSRSRLVDVARSGGMIIQRFEFEVSAVGHPVYDGTTYFGFFTPGALADQTGLRDISLRELSEAERAAARTIELAHEPPLAPGSAATTTPSGLPPPGRALSMIDQIDAFLPEGGSCGLGWIRGSKRVRPEEWFFRAHFLDDPVWPGSLGLEALLELLRVVAVERWGAESGGEPRCLPGALGIEHAWTYRGQVTPADKRVTVEAELTSIDDRRRRLIADGRLAVDGRVIYRMESFGVDLAAWG